MKLWQILIRTSTIACVLALLWHFSNTVRYGTYLVAEPSPLILWGEVALLAFILVVATANLIRDLRR